MPPLKNRSLRLPLRFLKSFKRSQNRKPPVVIYTVDSITPSQQVNNDDNVVVSNEMTIDTQQTQLSVITTTVSEGGVDVIKNPNVDVIEEECSIEEKHSQDEELKNVDGDGVDNKGYEHDEKAEVKDSIRNKKHHQIDIDACSSNDSGIEQDNNSS